MTQPRAIEALLVETHNWGATVAFWQALGYRLEFETDHHSGQLRHPDGGPVLFVAERAPDQPVHLIPVLTTPDATQVTLPTGAGPFVATHWGVLESALTDPDGRPLRVHAPPRPDSTAVRVALWRALHLLEDAPPHVLVDDLALALAAPEEGWRTRPDMSPFTRAFRASILARGRYTEDAVEAAVARGVGQYVILGAGLDTFAQRRADLADRLRIFEVDRPGPQAHKRARLAALGRPPGDNVRFVPVDFDAGEDLWGALAAVGWDPSVPTVVSAAGVIMYLERPAIVELLRGLSRLAHGSVAIVSFLNPLDRAPAEHRVGMERAAQGAAASGTPFRSYLEPEAMLALAREAGFTQVEHVSAAGLGDRYFASRTDGLRPPEDTEELLVARV